MSSNKLRASSGSAKGNPRTERRKHQVNISLSEGEIAWLHELANEVRSTSGRTVVPLASVAYDVFLAGRDALTAGV
jgi:hypothetical protein